MLTSLPAHSQYDPDSSFYRDSYVELAKPGAKLQKVVLLLERDLEAKGYKLGAGGNGPAGREAAAYLCHLPLSRRNSGPNCRSACGTPHGAGSVSVDGDGARGVGRAHGARAMLLRVKYDTGRLGEWARRLELRLPRNKAVAAVANKLARIAWAMLASGNEYRNVAVAAAETDSWSLLRSAPDERTVKRRAEKPCCAKGRNRP